MDDESDGESVGIIVGSALAIMVGNSLGTGSILGVT